MATKNANDIYSKIEQIISNLNYSSEEELVNELDKGFELEQKRIVFFGFSGRLANRFSLIDKEQVQPIEMQCLTLTKDVIPTFFRVAEFFFFWKKNHSSIKEYQLNEALDLFKKLEEEIAEAMYEADDSVIEFDDDCTDECLPGRHKCGK